MKSINTTVLSVVALMMGANCFAQWQQYSLPFSISGNGATYGNGQFAIATTNPDDFSPVVKASTDLSSWTDHPLSRSTGFPFVDFVDFVDGQFWLGMQAGGAGYLYNGTSPSNLTETRISTLPLHFTQFGEQYVVAGGGGGTRNALTSPDGITWTSRDLGDQSYVRGLASGNGLVVAVAPSNNNVDWLSFVSSDGVTWQKHTHTPSVEYGGKIVGIAFANGLFVALGSKSASGPGIAHEIFSYVSEDGVNWTEHTLADYYAANQIIATPSGFMVAAIKGTNAQTAHALTSTDGVSWTDELIGSAFEIQCLFQAGDAYVAATYNALYVKGELPSGGSSYPAPWQDAVSNGDDTVNLPWFGTFVIYEDNFIYHFEHGFLYTPSTDTESLWLYDFVMQDWLWTTADAYPFLFSLNREEWLFYFPDGTPAGRAFYGFVTEESFYVQ